MLDLTTESATWHILYRDEGPTGACGQSCSTTSPWGQLYRFRGTHEECMDRISKIKDRGRKNPTIEIFVDSGLMSDWFGFGEVKNIF